MRRRAGAESVWVIRDGSKMISTGCNEAEKARAARVYRDYTLSLPWEARPSRTLFAKQDRKPESECVVYFISCDQPDYPIKVGSTTNVEKRLAQIQNACPWPLRVLAVAAGGSSVEREIHRAFREDRLSGEWFKRTNGLMEIISKAA